MERDFQSSADAANAAGARSVRESSVGKERTMIKERNKGRVPCVVKEVVVKKEGDGAAA